MKIQLAQAPQDITETCPAIRDRHGFGFQTVQPTITFVTVIRTSARLYVFHGTPARSDWFRAGFSPIFTGSPEEARAVLCAIAGDTQAWRAFPVYLEESN